MLPVIVGTVIGFVGGYALAMRDVIKHYESSVIPVLVAVGVDDRVWAAVDQVERESAEVDAAESVGRGFWENGVYYRVGVPVESTEPTMYRRSVDGSLIPVVDNGA